MTRDLRLHSEFRSSQHYVIRLIKRRQKGKQERVGEGPQAHSSVQQPHPQPRSSQTQGVISVVQEEGGAGAGRALNKRWRHSTPTLQRRGWGRGPKEEVRGL